MRLNIKFLSHFQGYMIQTFDDKANRRDQSLIRCGTPESFSLEDLKALNNKGAGIFFTPNSFPKGERRKELCTKVNAWFYEVDDIAIEEQYKKIDLSPIKPSLVVMTDKSLHVYFLAKDGTIEKFEKIQKGLIQFFDSDKSIKDITRVMRMPGFYHNKGEPVMVEVLDDNGALYTEQELLKYFPYKENSEKKKVELKSIDPFWNSACKLDNKEILKRLSGTAIVNYETFSFESRSTGGEYIYVNGEPADAWLDPDGHIGSGKGGGPTYIQWLEYYGRSKAEIAEWIKANCKDLLANNDDPRISQSDQTLQILEADIKKLFKDELGKTYVSIFQDDKTRIYLTTSSDFQDYLRYQYYSSTEKIISKENINKVSDLITAKCALEGEVHKLSNRVALYKEDFWYDLGQSRSVKISEDKWEIVEDTPIIFKSYTHQNEQETPDKNNPDINLLFKYVRIKDENQKVLFIVWLVSCFVPEIAHPILVLYGEKGASKSTTMKFARSLIDPSKAPLLRMPRPDDLVQQLVHNYCPCYDNLSKISEINSDILCNAVTGGGNSKRKLYTDDEDVIYQFKRVVALNGINNVVERPDLLDRSILIELERIKPKERKTEADLEGSFSLDKPKILGAIFEILSKAKVEFKHIDLDEYPRMADFAKWGAAVSKTLYGSEEIFIKAYQDNIRSQNSEVIENDSVAKAITLLIKGQYVLEYSPTKLLEAINEVAEMNGIDKKLLPQSASMLGRKIKEVNSNLSDSGIEIQKLKDQDKIIGRFYRIFNHDVLSDFPDEEIVPIDSKDAKDGQVLKENTGSSVGDENLFNN